MKTKEEILKEATKKTLNIIEGSPLHSAVIDAMEEFASQSKWIDIRDKCPDFDVKVLLLSESATPTMDGKLVYGIGHRTNIKGTSFEKDMRANELLAGNNQFMRKDIVKFWQPLPEPPSLTD